MSRHATTSTPINPVLAERWSPRSYDTTAVLTPADLTASFEAARWSPSANNSQPWTYLVGFRGDDTFNAILPTLAGWNSAWMPNASAIVIAIAQVADAEGKANPYAAYDLGQSVAHFSVQAHTDGYHVHQVAGTDAAALKEAFNIPEGYEALVAMTVGKLAPASELPEALEERENAPRVRKDLSEVVHYTQF
ncbi:nitroreductase [Aurantimicrobium minutum]|uniref:nitroreductase family protein n=1 Tax=Aurantimicrobium minutum TaxID=708131 RepID=UPI0024762388|nr:nitroreductase family protein [Aurantimicrobium minutum]MDH6532038.1 nitroreductase [Aurantimicrobium minutum]